MEPLGPILKLLCLGEHGALPNVPGPAAGADPGDLQGSAEAFERLLCAILQAQALKESAGCTCAAAMNYDPSATVDDGSCEMPEVLPTLPNLLASYIQHHRTCMPSQKGIFQLVQTGDQPGCILLPEL